MNTEGLQHVGGGIWVEPTPTPEERHAAAMANQSRNQDDDLDVDVTDQDQQPEGIQDQPQQFFRKVRSPAVRSTNKSGLPNAVSSQPPLDGEPPVKDKVQLTAKINRDLHARLRIMSFQTHKNISELIEGWIAMHCPELPQELR